MYFFAEQGYGLPIKYYDSIMGQLSSVSAWNVKFWQSYKALKTFKMGLSQLISRSAPSLNFENFEFLSVT